MTVPTAGPAVPPRRHRPRRASDQYVADTIPQARLVLLDATGHCPHLSAPDDTITAIRDFLGSAVPASRLTAAESDERSDRARAAFLDALVHDDPVALYDSAPCGFLTTTVDGLIVKTNATFRTWVQREASEMVGAATFSDLLTVGSRLYYGTHLGPSLLMSGRIQEVALDLVRADGTRLPVLVNASLARGDDGHPRAVRFAVFDATERRSYERELLEAKQRAEASEREARELARTLQQTLFRRRRRPSQG